MQSIYLRLHSLWSSCEELDIAGWCPRNEQEKEHVSVSRPSFGQSLQIQPSCWTNATKRAPQYQHVAAMPHICKKWGPMSLVNNLCLLENHQSNQHQSTFNRIPMTLHCQHAPICPMSLTHVGPLGTGAPTLPTWTRHHPWRMAFSHSNLPDPGKALVKNLNFNNFNEKNTPRSPRFCLRKSRRLWWSESPAFCARLNRLSRLNCVEICLNLSAPSKRSRSKAHWPWPDKLHNVQNWSKQITICNIVEICQDMSRHDKSRWPTADTIWYHLIRVPASLISNLWEQAFLASSNARRLRKRDWKRFSICTTAWRQRHGAVRWIRWWKKPRNATFFQEISVSTPRQVAGSSTPPRTF